MSSAKMIDCIKKRKSQLAFELPNYRDFEKCSKLYEMEQGNLVPTCLYYSH